MDDGSVAVVASGCGQGCGGSEELVKVKVRVRARTESINRLSKKALARDGLEYPPEETAAYAVERPQNRGECLAGPNAQRPCPWVSCKHHLHLDVNEHTGSIKYNFPDLAVEELPETCSLDVADRNGITLEDVGAIMNLTRERIRQIEMRGLTKIQASTEVQGLLELADW